MPTYDDEDKAELLPGGGGDVDHGEDPLEEGHGGEEETLEEDRERAGETQSSGVYNFFFFIPSKVWSKFELSQARLGFVPMLVVTSRFVL